MLLDNIEELKGIFEFRSVDDAYSEMQELYGPMNSSSNQDIVIDQIDQKAQKINIELKAYSKKETNKKKTTINTVDLEIHQNPNLLLGLGITGTVVWSSSIVLSNFLLTFINYFENKTILELGSGTGLVGLSLAVFLTKKKKGFRMMLTDQRDMLGNLIKNLNENLNSNNVKIDELLWDDIPELCQSSTYHWFNDHKFNVLLVSDLIYNEHVSQILIKALKSLLLLNPEAVVFVSQELRAYHVIEEFLLNILEASIKLERIIDKHNNIPNNIVLYVAYIENEV